jgi:hypothetical protein
VAAVIILLGLEALSARDPRAQLSADLYLPQLLAAIGSSNDKTSSIPSSLWALGKCRHPHSLAQSSFMYDIFGYEIGGNLKHDTIPY